MKRIILLLTIVLLPACSNIDGEVLTFNGVGESWKVNYVSTDTGSTSQQITYTIVYTGEGEAPEVFNYTLSNMISQKDTSHTGAELNKDGYLESTKQNIGARVPKDDIIIVELAWNGKSEKLNLELQ
ncbi:hypothetical protein [Psychrobacillus antarcticus]|uniref:hypothetical protein n=1 Tax=Psychrobacillus antarcticus TaxID=2879115 RepID=UPI002407AF4D|nr:hypothetical protein [Psychrobacillus antarcticus]